MFLNIGIEGNGVQFEIITLLCAENIAYNVRAHANED